MSGSREIVASGAEPGSSALERTTGRSLASADRLDLSGSISFFRRRLKIIIAFAILGLLAGLAISLLSKKVYRAEATVMLVEQSSGLPSADDTPTAPVPLTSQLVDTQVEIIKSRQMARRVADALKIDKGLDAEERRTLFDLMQEKVNAQRTGTSFALTISYDAAVPSDARQIVNEYAHQFANWQTSQDEERNSQIRKQVEERLVSLREQAQADTSALQQYRIANNLLSTSGASLTEQEISNYNLEMTRARAESAEANARLQTALGQLRSGSSGDDVGEALDSPVVSSLRTQEGTLAGEVASLEARYGPNHPQLIRTRNQLAQVRQQIQDEIGRVISNLRAKKDVSEDRLASIAGSLSHARSMLASNNAAMVGLSELERSAEASQGIYETYLNSYKQLLAAEGTSKPMARILSLANDPMKPISPNLKLNLALALVIGLGLGVIAAYIADALFHGIKSAHEVEHDLGENCLASIPLLASVHEGKPHAISAIRDNPKSVFTESFRVLSTAIDQATMNRAQVIAITSALPGEGKTVLSCCLSHVLAADGERTMLIDCDLRRRGISRLLDVGPDQPGLIEVLNGTSPLDVEELLRDRVLCVLPLGPKSDAPDKLLTGQPFIDLLEKLRPHFDRIILDLPPILPIAATRSIACQADAVVLAAHWCKTSSFAIRTARARLPKKLVNVVGVALNQVDLRKKAYFDREDVSFYYSKYSEYYS
ncbi:MULTISPECIES: GumC family protein [Novosphingobium]|uniref:Capsular exopolysaccharide family n=1 Tax=Novosphingobium mathurense TaxID=428990 RepID=A0A1U6HMV8_9SPHN|nr:MULTISPECIES: Wzz/FepE/Etk N-terminal domain-containing protein [Novosphingobium]CDO34245.1 putative Capsular exopolysaccharide family protein [Novosphingobium sp. KN65.2]SLJ96951.1 capsular exopolysaccharide family [Novosphingobium mathurense]